MMIKLRQTIEDSSLSLMIIQFGLHSPPDFQLRRLRWDPHHQQRKLPRGRHQVRIMMRTVEKIKCLQEGAGEVVGACRQLGGGVRQHRHDEQEGGGRRAFCGD